MELMEFNILPADLQERELDTGESLGSAFEELAEAWPDPHASLEAYRAEWPLGWLDLPQRTDYRDQCTELAVKLARDCEELVVCGIGGSALGTQAVYAALDWPLESLRTIHVLDNIDPSMVAFLTESVAWESAALNVISKSGGTLETMSGFFHMLQMFKQLGRQNEGQAGRVIATTDAAKGILHDFASERGWPILPVPDDVGGRFSVLSPVGLFPLAFAGIDIVELLAGAQEMQEYCAAQTTGANPAWQLAALHFLLHTRGGITNIVQYIYGDQLVLLGDWFRQLWAESLAKAIKADGTASGIGQTPVVARGTTDQHSQNQLYMEGPNDKLFGMLTCHEWPADPQIKLPKSNALEPLAYINQRTCSEILGACYSGTRDALREAGRPVYEIILPKLGAREIGAYLQLWMLATAYGGLLYEINAFDQPGVEHSKKRAKASLGG